MILTYCNKACQLLKVKQYGAMNTMLVSKGHPSMAREEKQRKSSNYLFTSLFVSVNVVLRQV